MATTCLNPHSRQLTKLYFRSQRALAPWQNQAFSIRCRIRQISNHYHPPFSLDLHRSISSSTPLHHDKASNNAAATEATDATVENTDEKPKLAANLIEPKPLFPWRHSPHPLPRLIPPDKSKGGMNYYESDYYTKGGHLGPGWPRPMEPFFRAASQACCMWLLGLKFPSMLVPWITSAWIHDMEDAFCDAFGKGVNGLILGTYSFEDIDVTPSEDDFDVDFEHTIAPNPLSDTDSNSTIDPPNESQIEEQEQNSMLQQSLRNLYQSAREHSHPNEINIVLRSQPQFAVIESMFPVFGMSRNLVHNHPNLRHSYRNLASKLQHKERELEKKLNTIQLDLQIGQLMADEVRSLIDHSAKLSPDGKGVISIIAQVSIQCREIFCVKDVKSGEILQGEGDGQARDVTHLVRFEIVLKKEKGYWEIGRWQITDWDDLLEGNVWFT